MLLFRYNDIIKMEYQLDQLKEDNITEKKELKTIINAKGLEIENDMKQKLDDVEKKIAEIKETNQFIIPRSKRYCIEMHQM